MTFATMNVNETTMKADKQQLTSKRFGYSQKHCILAILPCTTDDKNWKFA